MEKLRRRRPVSGLRQLRSVSRRAFSLLAAFMGIVCLAPASALAQSAGYPPANPNFGQGEYATPANYQGEEELQSVPSLQQAIPLGENGNVTVYGTPDAMSFDGGANYIGRWAGMLRELQLGFYGNEMQRVFTGGGNLALLERDGFGVAARGLFGSTDAGILGDSRFAYTFDGHVGGCFQNNDYGEHWVKAGGFVDMQNDWGKAGFSAGLLLLASEPFPVTMDFALGFGVGGTIQRTVASPPTLQVIDFFDVADRDYQYRLGVFLNPFWQVGLTANYFEWDAPYYNDLGLGGFTNVYLGRARVNLDFSVGDQGFRGYINTGFAFGPTPTRTMNQRGAWCVDGQQWLFQPVLRDINLQVRKRTQVNAIDLFTLLTTGGIVVIPSRKPDICPPGTSCFELELFVTNDSTSNFSGVTVNNISVAGTAGAVTTGVSGQNFGTVAPGQTVTTNLDTDVNIAVPVTAPPGSTILVSYDVTVDGQTRRFTVGPMVVGSLANGQQFIGQ